MSAEEAPVGYTNGTTFNWNTHGQVMAAATVLPALGLITIALRFWSRFHKRTGFGVDDAFIFLALACVVGLGITFVIGVNEGAFAHTTPPSPNPADPDAQLYEITASQELAEKLEFAFFLLMVAAYGFIKLSVLFFYRRIFVKRTTSKFDIATKVAIGITAVWTAVFFLLGLFMCGRYINLNWGPLINWATRCLDFYQYNNALFISDLITDVLVICLPIPLIWRLHMTTQRKFATIGVLLLGALSVGASIVRLVYSSQYAAAGIAKPTDVNESQTTVLYWGMLEAGISLIASNLPSIYFLITKQSLQSFAASIRTQISLDSLRSQGSKRRNESMASHVPAAGSDGAEDMPAFSVGDMDHTTVVEKPRVIYVADGMERQGKMV